jgi:dTDP-4-amino-4,6-dideoxygalactose transaminase
MGSWKVPFVDYPGHYRSMEAEIDGAIKRVLVNGDLMMRGDMLEFERGMAAFLGTTDAVAVANCTDGLFLSLLAAGIGPGDEVITVCHTFVATIEAIVHTGATPIIVDIRDDFLMDPTKLEGAVTSKTKAIIPVHMNGRVCEMDTIMAFAKKHNLIVIEDAAQAVGGSYDGKRGGAWGLTGCFSFYPAKLLGCFGDGGLVSTSSPEIAEKLRLYRDHGRQGKDTLALYGYNSRLDNIQAAVLNVKLKRVPAWCEKRRALAKVYDDGLASIPEVIRPPGPSNGRYHDVYQNYVIRTARRDDLVRFLKESGIEILVSNPIPVHHQKALNLSHFDLPMTTKVASEVLSLPLIPEIELSQAQIVVDTIRQFMTQSASGC